MSRSVLAAAVRADVLRVRAGIVTHYEPATRHARHVRVWKFSPEVVKHLRHSPTVAGEERAA